MSCKQGQTHGKTDANSEQLSRGGNTKTTHNSKKSLAVSRSLLLSLAVSICLSLALLLLLSRSLALLLSCSLALALSLSVFALSLLIPLRACF